MKRRYELKKRAERQAQTRQRIVEAAVALHRERGVAGTTVTEIAERAGVQRLTVYNHFPDEGALLEGCSGHWGALHPLPDVSAWAAIGDLEPRVRAALRDLYAYYEETEPMTEKFLRDPRASRRSPTCSTGPGTRTSGRPAMSWPAPRGRAGPPAPPARCDLAGDRLPHLADARTLGRPLHGRGHRRGERGGVQRV